MDALQTSTLKSVPLVHRGKVRDSYALGDAHLLMIATAPLSDFPLTPPRPIPRPGGALPPAPSTEHSPARWSASKTSSPSARSIASLAMRPPPTSRPR